VIEKFRGPDEPLESLIPKLNPLLRTYSQITWIGTRRDLQEGSGQYERQVRQEFREFIESSEGTRPILRSEAAQFLDFLSEYDI
jgi:hypothetical protein